MFFVIDTEARRLARAIPAAKGGVPKTQKAKGVLALESVQIPTLNTIALTGGLPKEKCSWVQEQIERCVPLLCDEKLSFLRQPMGRPCPPRARHGFEPSVRVRNIEELYALYARARALEPNAEIMLQPFIPGEVNAVITPTMMVVGPGHDGATGGRESHMLRLPSTQISDTQDETNCLREIAGIAKNETIYLEVVNCFATQLRAGPKPPDGFDDFVPKRMNGMKVKHVMRLKGDVDEVWWEKEVTRLPPNTVVVHLGASLGCHVAVHCILHGVPYFTSRTVAVGEVLEYQEVDYGEFDEEAMRVGLIAGCGRPTSERGHGDLLVALVGSHIAAVAARHSLSSYFVGLAAGYFARYGLPIVAGERVRHYGRTKAGASKLWNKETQTEGYRLERFAFYNTSWPLPSRTMHAIAAEATQCYLTLGWPRGYGGPLWGEAGMLVLRHVERCRQFFENPTAANAKALVAGQHTLLNAAHNGGWLFNKYGIDSETVDKFGRGSSLGYAATASHVLKCAAEAMEGKTTGTLKRGGKWLGGLPKFTQSDTKFLGPYGASMLMRVTELRAAGREIDNDAFHPEICTCKACANRGLAAAKAIGEACGYFQAQIQQAQVSWTCVQGGCCTCNGVSIKKPPELFGKLDPYYPHQVYAIKSQTASASDSW